jgi:PAS domain-containing protein
MSRRRLLRARDNVPSGDAGRSAQQPLLGLPQVGDERGIQHGPRELNLVDPDEGNDLLFEVLAHSLGERSGPEDSVLSVLRDVTDLRRAANELERQVQRVRQAEISVRGERDRLNLVLENVADPILVTDERSNIILMNDQAEVLFQVTEAEPRTRRELGNVRGNDTKFTSFISEFAMLDEDSRRERMTLVYPRSGTNLPLEVVSANVKTTRRAIAVVSVCKTHQGSRERRLRRAEEAQQPVGTSHPQAIADLAEQSSLYSGSHGGRRANKLSRNSASMSHELRAPISALIGYTALLLDGVLGEMNARQRDALLRGRSAANLPALIGNILDSPRSGRQMHFTSRMCRCAMPSSHLRLSRRAEAAPVHDRHRARLPADQLDRTKVNKFF